MRTWWWMLAVMGCGAPQVGNGSGNYGDQSVVSETDEGASSDTASPVDGVATGPGADLFAWCERWIECGGTWYETPRDCVDATYAYWGQCDAVTAALDEFAVCMLEVPCSEFDADTFDPAESSCSGVWEGVVASACRD